MPVRMTTALCLLMTGLAGGCSTYVENEASLDFEPIYELSLIHI